MWPARPEHAEGDMGVLSYAIAPEIFERFPGYVRGVVVARAVGNGPAPAPLVATLRDAEASVRNRLRLEDLAEHPRIKSWRDAYRTFGAKPSEFRSSIEALVRRVLRGEPLPSINALVDIGTIVSLRHLAPVGSHAVDVCRTDLALRLASGQETFIPFGSNAPEQPLPGEVIFAEGDIVLTRRWTWRQANHTLTLPETKAAEFNVDGLPPVALSDVEQACADIEALIQRFCGGSVRQEVLTPGHPRMSLAP